MDAKRIIPVLELSDGRVMADAPREWACRLALEGADGILFRERAGSPPAARGARAGWIREVAGSLSIPFALEARFTRLEELDEVIEAGADQVILEAVSPLLAAAARRFGRTRLCVAGEALPEPGPDGPCWRVDGQEARAWMADLEQFCGEILLEATPETDAATLFQGAARAGLPVLCRTAGDPVPAAAALLHGADGLACPASVRTAASWKSLLSTGGLAFRDQAVSSRGSRG